MSTMTGTSLMQTIFALIIYVIVRPKDFRPKAEREFLCDVILAESRKNRQRETISAKMTPKAERFRQVPKLSLSAERPKRGPFGRTIIYSNEGEVKEVPRIFFTLSGFINVIMVS